MREDRVLGAESRRRTDEEFVERDQKEVEKEGEKEGEEKKGGGKREETRRRGPEQLGHVIYVSSLPRYAATALTVETRRRLGLVGSGRLIGSRACAHRLTTSIRGDRLLPSACHSLSFSFSLAPLPFADVNRAVIRCHFGYTVSPGSRLALRAC